jgi:hypothetical protein
MAKNALPPLAERFWARVAKAEPDECWDWTGRTDRDGYGRITENQIAMLAHRVSYAICYGEFDQSLHVLHRCDRPCCVNPRHLWLGTHALNMADMREKKRHGGSGSRNPKTHCPHGHEYTPENIIYDGGKRCRTCKNERARKYRHARRAASALEQTEANASPQP